LVRRSTRWATRCAVSSAGATGIGCAVVTWRTLFAHALTKQQEPVWVSAGDVFLALRVVRCSGTVGGDVDTGIECTQVGIRTSRWVLAACSRSAVGSVLTSTIGGLTCIGGASVPVITRLLCVDATSRGGSITGVESTQISVITALCGAQTVSGSGLTGVGYAFVVGWAGDDTLNVAKQPVSTLPRVSGSKVFQALGVVCGSRALGGFINTGITCAERAVITIVREVTASSCSSDGGVAAYSARASILGTAVSVITVDWSVFASSRHTRFAKICRASVAIITNFGILDTKSGGWVTSVRVTTCVRDASGVHISAEQLVSALARISVRQILQTS